MNSFFGSRPARISRKTFGCQRFLFQIDRSFDSRRPVILVHNHKNYAVYTDEVYCNSFTIKIFSDPNLHANLAANLKAGFILRNTIKLDSGKCAKKGGKYVEPGQNCPFVFDFYKARPEKAFCVKIF